MALFKNRRKKSVALIAAAGVTLAGTGVAFAYWTANGSGTGTATTGQSVAFVITADAPQGAAMTPGGTGQTVNFTVRNPGAGTQQLSLVTVSVANADGSTYAVPGCSSADYTAVVSVLTSYGPMAPQGVANGIATISMVNTGVNQDACKGLTVPLYFVAA